MLPGPESLMKRFRSQHSGFRLLELHYFAVTRTVTLLEDSGGKGMGFEATALNGGRCGRSDLVLLPRMSGGARRLDELRGRRGRRCRRLRILMR
jgi:hypothetical protein